MARHDYRPALVNSFPRELAATIGESYPTIGQLSLVRDCIDASSIVTVSMQYPAEIIQAPSVSANIAKLKVATGESHDPEGALQIRRFNRVSAKLLQGVPATHIILSRALTALHSQHYKDQLNWMLGMEERTDGAWRVRMVHPDTEVPTSTAELPQHNFSTVSVAHSNTRNGPAAHEDRNPVLFTSRNKLAGFKGNKEAYYNAGTPGAVELYRKAARLGDLAMSHRDTAAYVQKLLSSA